MKIQSPPASVEEFLELLDLSSGERLLWTSLLSQCLSLESPDFVLNCFEFGFNRRHFETLVQCLRLADKVPFSGSIFTTLLNRVESKEELHLSLKTVLEFLQTHQYKATPKAIMSYIECAQQSIELGRESTSLVETVERYLETSGMHEAVPGHQRG